MSKLPNVKVKETRHKWISLLPVLVYLHSIDCLVHGGWSPWTEWNLCPQTCGKAYRARTRTCTNPEPKHNGRLCIGSEREEEPCPDIACSGESARTSSWSGENAFASPDRDEDFIPVFLEWEKCSRSCGGGIQKRRRTCLMHGDKCSECLEETRLCNESPCPSRFTFQCDIHSLEDHLSCATSILIEYRICT